MKRIGMLLAVVMLVGFVGAASAQTDIGFKGVGGKLGLVSISDDVGSTIGFGGIADLGTFAPNVHLTANIDYWSKTKKEGGAEVSLRDIAITGTVSYTFTTGNEKLSPYVAGGLGLHLLNAKAEVFGYKASESDTKIGFHFGGGLLISSSPKMDLVVDGRYVIVQDADYLALQGGAVFKIGE